MNRCGPTHWNRRTLLKAGGASWLTLAAAALTRADEDAPKGAPAKSVVVLWMQGGPSQLDTFDPKPGTKHGGNVTSIKTAAPGVELASTLPQLADQMDSVALVRSVVSKEGDHERATYNVKTGFRPDPTLVHPALGSVVCNQLHEELDIPRHVSILPGQWPARGGYLGDQFDAFKMGDPRQPVPDIAARVPKERLNTRISDLEKLESVFQRRRMPNLDSNRTLHMHSTRKALDMMSAKQLAAFDVNEAPQSLREEYGDSAFGRGCLAAARLIAEGVRCVEVTLGGWDTHANNAELQAGRVGILDPAFAALIRDLKRRKLLDSTVVICGGEFGRTPSINPAGGRDHWPHGFSIALAGGGIQGGRVIGETPPEPKLGKDYKGQDIVDPYNVEDIHATVLHTLGINFEKELDTPIGRPMAISKGKVIRGLLDV